jgi:formiminotetrahydrofolate cyclodeaminase
MTVPPKGDPPTPSSLTLDAYLDAVASGDPTPGGGSVVAIVAALGAALGAMVCNLTIGRLASSPAEPDLRAALDRLTTLRHALCRAATDDEAAYLRYRTASALPKATDVERAARTNAVQTALVDAADVPLAVATACLDLLHALEPVARLGNLHALSDAETGALLADVALRGALLNVRGNARLLRDSLAADRYRQRATDLETSSRIALDRVLNSIRDRTSP